MRLRIPVEVQAPDGATHYCGHLGGDVREFTYYKARDIGVAGQHWFYWSEQRKEWRMASHHQPNWTHLIPEEWKK